MKFVCANADLIQGVNLDTDYDYITAKAKSHVLAIETLANSFAKSKSDCVLFVWDTDDPYNLVRATEEACVEDINFKKIIDDLEKNLDYSILGDFDLESIELENGMTISVVKYVTMNNLRESRKSIKESSDVANTIASEINKSYWIDKLIDDLDRHYESMEKAWLKNLDKLSDEDILDIVDDCMGKSKTLVGKSEMLKNKMIDDLSKKYDDYIDDIDRQIRIGKSEDEIKEMIETTLENDIKMYLKLAYNNKASSNYFMVKFAEDNLI